jgi:hypothetical protein
VLLRGLSVCCGSPSQPVSEARASSGWRPPPGRADLQPISKRMGTSWKASPCGVNDRDHGQQFRADFLRVSAPTAAEGIEKYPGSGVIRGDRPGLRSEARRRVRGRCVRYERANARPPPREWRARPRCSLNERQLPTKLVGGILTVLGWAQTRRGVPSALRVPALCHVLTLIPQELVRPQSHPSARWRTVFAA